MPPVDIIIDEDELDESDRGTYSNFDVIRSIKKPTLDMTEKQSAIRISHKEFSFTLAENAKAWDLFD